MISLVIYGVIAVALAASAGFLYLTLSNVTRQTIQLQENQVRMETAVAALRSSMLNINPANGFLLPPAGFTGVAPNAYTQLPANLGTVGSSPWGQPYLYCPVMAQTTATGITAASPVVGGTVTAGTVTSPSTATYNTSLYSSSATGGLNYVTAVTGLNAQNGQGYLGYIVSSQGPGQTIPDCSSIVVAATGVTVPNGTVRAVAAVIPYTQRIVGSTDRLEIYVGTAATGNGSGQDLNNLMAAGVQGNIDNALNVWLALQPRLTEIYLTGAAAYATTNNLDGETVAIPGAQGQNSSLIIANDPTNAAQATLTFSQPLFLTSNTTFQNLTINHNTPNSPAITAYKTLTLRSTTDTTNLGGANSGGINLYNTSLTVNSSTINGAAIGGSNSSIQFLNSSLAAGMTFTGTTIGGNQMRISFDDGANYTFADAGSTVPAISLTGGGLNIGANSALTITTGQAQGILVSGGLLNIGSVGKTLTITASEPAVPAQQTSGGIDLIDGSSGVIQAPVLVKANGTLTSAIFVRGSSLAINANISATNLTGAAGVNANNFINASVINAQEATITGSGSLSAGGVNFACIQILNQNIINPGPGNIPIYTITQPVGNFAGYASFQESQYGYPLLLGLNLGYLGTNVASLNAALLITASNGNNPYIYEPTPPAPGVPTPYHVGGGDVGDPPATTSLQQQNFEAAVRTIVNREYVQGLHINFTGGCT